MKIKTIELYGVRLPYAQGTYRLSGGRSYDGFDSSIVRIETHCGIEGFGESTPFGSTYIEAHAEGARAGITEIAADLIGLDPRHVDRINDKMDGVLRGHNHAKAAIDIACWDIFGKSVGMPVSALLGGSTNFLMPVISSIFMGDPDEMRIRVMEHRKRGYKGHSIKIGALDSEGGPYLDAERVKACLSDRQPGEIFLVDANGGLTPETALRFLRLLPNDLEFILEAPCHSWRETISLRNRCDVPIMLDELIKYDEDVAQLISLDAADGIGLKVSKAGGLTHCRRQRDICRAAALTMSVQDTVGSAIAFAAIAHLGQTVPQHLLKCILDVRDMVTLETAKFEAKIIDGGIRAPDLPGLGLTVNRSVLGAPLASW